MKIGIDAREAALIHSGKSAYTFYLLRELTKIEPGHEFVLYVQRLTPQLANLANVRFKVIEKDGLSWHRAVAKDWQQEKGDLFFAPTSYIIPYLLPKNMRSIITVHDIVSFLHPSMHQLKATLIERFFLKRVLKKTSHILVPSRQTEQDLHEKFCVATEKISVVPLGVDESFFGLKPNPTILKKYNIQSPYILTVSGLEPRKNVSRLIDAFLDLRIRHKEVTLVIAGGIGWKSHETLRKIQAYPNTIRFIMSCPYEDIQQLYTQAKLFVFPSLYEGFGLPPLEAMAAGCPVVCSNVSSLPEVCGDACVYVDPHKPADIAAGIERVLASEQLRTELQTNGQLRAREFSWKRTARQTLQTFSAIL